MATGESGGKLPKVPKPGMRLKVVMSKEMERELLDGIRRIKELNKEIDEMQRQMMEQERDEQELAQLLAEKERDEQFEMDRRDG